MIKFRLDYAKKYLDDAFELYRQDRFNSAVSRAYYASYQAMWSALGEPLQGNWRHLAIIKHFVRGYWFAPDYRETGPGLLENKRLPLRRLYSYRIQSDYNAENISGNSVKQLLDIVKDIILIIEEKGENTNGTDTSC
ncbi:HEPN domain-containing protein [Desulfobacterales bacterium HSG17]|nr:HEPN domain-containing protein [Desulfobacterales bacterium HSG17]